MSVVMQELLPGPHGLNSAHMTITTLTVSGLGS